jgi:hypothetical protein
MINLILREIVENSGSNREGSKLFSYLKDAYLKKEQILLNVDNDLALSSSFLNTSIGLFLEEHGVSEFKKTVKFKGSKAQFERLANYIKKFSEAHLS